MKKLIKKHIAKSNLIKVYVDVEGEEDEYWGIPIRVSRTLFVLHDIDEFHFDGYRVVRLQDIVRIRRSRFETTQQKILKSTGELKKHADLKWLRAGSWKSLMKRLKSKKVCVCVESALIDVNVFAVGEIQALKDEAVVLRSFDAHGAWCKPRHRIRYSDITGAQFGDEYSKTFHRYVKNR